MHCCLILIWNTCYETKKRNTNVFIHPWILQQKAPQCFALWVPSAQSAFGAWRLRRHAPRRAAPSALRACGACRRWASAYLPLNQGCQCSHVWSLQARAPYAEANRAPSPTPPTPPAPPHPNSPPPTPLILERKKNLPMMWTNKGESKKKSTYDPTHHNPTISDTVETKHFFAVTVIWKSAQGFWFAVTYGVFWPWWVPKLRNVGQIFTLAEPPEEIWMKIPPWSSLKRIPYKKYLPLNQKFLNYNNPWKYLPLNFIASPIWKLALHPNGNYWKIMQPILRN